MIKTFLKLLLATGIYFLLFMLANTLLPFSQGFRDLGASGNPVSLLYLFLSSAWTCFSIYFVIRHAKVSGKVLFVNILIIFFFIQFFMTQIETIFFGHAFYAVTTMDFILIMFVGLFPLLGAVALLVGFFQNKNNMYESVKLNIREISIKLGIIGIIYLCIYMFFGYFVAWQFEELRQFYTGSTEKLSFWGQMANNIKNDPLLIPFQIIRGILFGLSIILLKKIINGERVIFVTSVCLIYLCTAIVLIIPNVLFPDIVRIAHLIEMSNSMLIFGIIVGNILFKIKGSINV